MRRLFLIRHAKTEPAVGRNDYERRLTERGRDDARRVALGMAAREMLPDVLVHSGAARARETAEILAAQWARAVLLEQDGRLYDANERALLARARALPDARVRVAFVGHNPGMGELAGALAGSGEHSDRKGLAGKFPTCAVAALDFPIRRWNEVAPEKGLLTLFLTPSELEAGA